MCYHNKCIYSDTPSVLLSHLWSMCMVPPSLFVQSSAHILAPSAQIQHMCLYFVSRHFYYTYLMPTCTCTLNPLKVSHIICLWFSVPLLHFSFLTKITCLNPQTVWYTSRSPHWDLLSEVLLFKLGWQNDICVVPRWRHNICDVPTLEVWCFLQRFINMSVSLDHFNKDNNYSCTLTPECLKLALPIQGYKPTKFI